MLVPGIAILIIHIGMLVPCIIILIIHIGMLVPRIVILIIYYFMRFTINSVNLKALLSN